MSDLTVLEDQIEAILQDSSNIAWTVAEIDAGIRLALAEYNQVAPYELNTVITLAAAGREISLTDASLAGLMNVLEVWWPFVTSPETWPPPRVPSFNFSIQAGVPILSLPADAASVPAIGQKVRLWWTKPHTINTFDSATATTLTLDSRSLLAIGAAGHAALSGAMDRAEVLDRQEMVKWGNARLKEFYARLQLIAQASQRFHRQPLTFRDRVEAILLSAGNYPWPNVDLEGAIRQALADYSQVKPQELVTVITIEEAGREIDVTDLLDRALGANSLGVNGVTEVWWPYSSTSEIWPPNRVSGFRTWWDDNTLVLFLSSKDGSQPQVDDEMRLWWTKPHTISGIDGATSTTLSADAQALVAIGSAGYAALAFIPHSTNLTEIGNLTRWGNAMLASFRTRLDKIRSEAVRSKGEPFGGGWSMDKWDIRQ
jgi:hypothetical protein